MNIPPAAQCARWTGSLKNNTLFKFHHKLEEIREEQHTSHLFLRCLQLLQTCFRQDDLVLGGVVENIMVLCI